MRVKKVTIDQTTAEERREIQRFSGTVRIQVLQDLSDGPRIQAVFFEPSARTRPHIHKHDQVLHCIEGEGVVEVATGDGDNPETVRIRAGDTVFIPKDTWHWHGAIRTSRMMHISIVVPDKRDQWVGVDEKDWAEYREG
jgi:quercetin dioxygenase-like cupin family protein